MADRPAPLLLVAGPADNEAPFGSYEAVLSTGRHLLAAALSQRLGAQGAAIQPIPSDHRPGAFHWG
ncbi:MAG: hypothetical protein EHM90_04435, partial [Chloroflexi bacterium]